MTRSRLVLDRTDEKLLQIEVVFATVERQELIELQMPAGSTAADAVAGSGLRNSFPGDIGPDNPLGIWGRLVEPGHSLEDGDRVEIYRKLQRDPREARRLLAQQGRSMNQGRAGNTRDDDQR